MNYDRAEYSKVKNGHVRMMNRVEFRTFRDMIAYDQHDSNYIDDQLNRGDVLKTLFGSVRRES